jgi:hypothetical protein
MGGMKETWRNNNQYQNKKARRDDCARILQPKCTESSFRQGSARNSDRG